VEVIVKLSVMVLAIFLGILIHAAVGTVVAIPLKWCWNSVVPDIFHVRAISWGEAWFLYIIACILFKSSEGHSGESKDSK
jgi:hypothetical protein